MEKFFDCNLLSFMQCLPIIDSPFAATEQAASNGFDNPPGKLEILAANHWTG